MKLYHGAPKGTYEKIKEEGFKKGYLATDIPACFDYGTEIIEFDIPEEELANYFTPPMLLIKRPDIACAQYVLIKGKTIQPNRIMRKLNSNDDEFQAAYQLFVSTNKIKV